MPLPIPTVINIKNNSYKQHPEFSTTTSRNTSGDIEIIEKALKTDCEKDKQKLDFFCDFKQQRKYTWWTALFSL